MTKYSGLEIAIIGQSIRVPGAQNVDMYWENLINEVNSITFFGDEELLQYGVNKENLADPSYVKAKGCIDNAMEFDAQFFGYSPKEARIMDPQIRVFHELCWEALEDSGYIAENYNGKIGLYAGSSSNIVWQAVNGINDSYSPSEQFEADLLTNSAFMCSRISYKLNLVGPSLHIQTGCSTSLMAVHLACRSLLLGECNIALAGGVSISTPHLTGYYYQDGMLYSPDGLCRTFDENAQGSVMSEGAGVVVLKPLKNAIRDRDTIRAVIKGTAANNDGKNKIGYSAPSIVGQAEVIRDCHKTAKINPETISFVETHGSGTIIGDPIEVEALKLAFGNSKTKYCALGSVKTNIGHTEAAAGVVGLIKTVLSLENKVIPANLNFNKLNHRINLSNSPFYINTKLKHWDTVVNPRRAGVSSFGVGGNNVHVVLEEYVDDSPHTCEVSNEVLLISARTRNSLYTTVSKLIDYLTTKKINLGSVAYTLAVGRKEFDFRYALSCESKNEAIEKLSNFLETNDRNNINQLTSKKIVFVFPGQGSQYVMMGRQLYEEEEVFRESLDRCFNILLEKYDADFREFLYPSEHSYDRYLSEDTSVAQPIIFSFEYALSKLLISWGITPDAMIGYSFGEYVAAHLADVLSLEDALHLVVTRGKLMKGLPKGSMLNIPYQYKDISMILPDGISLAVDNEDSCIVSGTIEMIDEVEKKLKQNNRLCMPVNASLAGHSKLVEKITPQFQDIISAVNLNEPKIPIISSVTGDWIIPNQIVDQKYWVRHMRETVRFIKGIKMISKENNIIFLEIGPGRSLTNMINRYISKDQGQFAIDTVRMQSRKIHDQKYIYNTVANLWNLGATINWDKFYKNKVRKRVPLPTYSFDRENYDKKDNKNSNIIQNLNGDKQYKQQNKQDKKGSKPLRIEKQVPLEKQTLKVNNNWIEKELHMIWSDFFEHSHISIDDSFFEIGGDSLSASTIVNKMNEKYGLNLPTSDIYMLLTIREFAKKISYELNKNH